MDVQKTKRRLRAFIEIDTTNGCWLWQGCRFNEGYAAIGVDGKTRLAHRVSYEIFVGEIPIGRMVLHRCDTKRCINPDHLYLGDAKQNMRDALDRGQQPIGNRHWRRQHPERQRGDDAPHRTLCAKQVREIRAKFSQGLSQSALARSYGVSVTQVHRIVHRQSWSYVE